MGSVTSDYSKQIKYLYKLKDKGVTMIDAAPQLMDKYPELDKGTAMHIVKLWMLDSTKRPRGS
jgi:hypothetical protein